MTKLRYDLIGSYESGIKIHPQTDVESKGMIITDYHGVSVADCIIITVEEVVGDLPDYMEVIKPRDTSKKVTYKKLEEVVFLNVTTASTEENAFGFFNTIKGGFEMFDGERFFISKEDFTKHYQGKDPNKYTSLIMGDFKNNLN